MKARVQWLDGRAFVGESGSGHAVVMDGAPESGGRNIGIRPMEMLLIGIQFWFADNGGAYALWYAPLLLLMIYRPAGVELEPPVRAGRGWARRTLAAGWRRVRGTETPTGIAA